MAEEGKEYNFGTDPDNESPAHDFDEDPYASPLQPEAIADDD